MEFLKTPSYRSAMKYLKLVENPNLNSVNVEVRWKKRVSHLVQLPDCTEQSND
jgi:hypothetical protein